MKYTDGNQVKVGDYVLIDKRLHGVVVANMDGDEYSNEYPKEIWSHLVSGILIDTDFGGLVHYDQNRQKGEMIELVKRA